MLESEFSEVCRAIHRGKKFRLGRNPAGRMKLKLHAGPFGIFVRRYEITDVELTRLRKLLNLASAKRSTNADMLAAKTG